MGNKCITIVEQAIKKATLEMQSKVEEVPEHIIILFQYCDALDDVVSNNDGEVLGCTIDKDKLKVYIRIKVESLCIRDPVHDPFQLLVERADSVNIKFDTSDSIVINFEFPSVWNEV